MGPVDATAALPDTAALPGVKCYISTISKSKRPIPNFKDLVIASVMLGQPRTIFDGHPELRQQRIDWAKSNGYNYCELQGTQLIKDYFQHRMVEWDKIPFVLNLLQHYQYVLMMDSDVLLGNTCVSLSPLLRKMGDAEMLLSEDITPPINTGVALFKHGRFTLDFFNKLVKFSKEAQGPLHPNGDLRKHWPFEQGGITNLASHMKQRFCLPDPKLFTETAAGGPERNDRGPMGLHDHFVHLKYLTKWSPPGPECKAIVHALGEHFQQFYEPMDDHPHHNKWFSKKGTMFVHITGPRACNYKFFYGACKTSAAKYGVMLRALRHDKRLCTPKSIGDPDCHCTLTTPPPDSPITNAMIHGGWGQ